MKKRVAGVAGAAGVAGVAGVAGLVVLDFGQFRLRPIRFLPGQFDFCQLAEVELAEVEIGRSRLSQVSGFRFQDRFQVSSSSLQVAGCKLQVSSCRFQVVCFS